MTTWMRRVSFTVLGLAILTASAARADEAHAWSPAAAAKYLDDRAAAWFASQASGRGAGATRTTCVSCHTLLPYALARSALRKITGADSPTEFEQKILAQTKMRVENWDGLAAEKFGLFYDFNERKKVESRGTEAVLAAVVLAFDDRGQGRTAPADFTRKAFAHLGATQAADGDHAGSWEWLEFGLEPWEAPQARYYGAALAAIAVGTAPGYDPATDAPSVDRLRAYLKRGFAGQTLHNRLWALWAAAKLDGVLSQDEQKQVIRNILEKQGPDGGWGLPALGSYTRHDKTPQDGGADGYATGLILHVLQTIGVAKDDPAVAKGLRWLRTHQAATGEWRGVSVNKKRDSATHAGKFMSDAATAYAVLALSH